MTGPEDTTAAEVAEASAEVVAHGASLLALGVDHRCRTLAAASRVLADPMSSHGAELRSALRQESPLSQAMVEWCLSTTLASVREDALLDLFRGHALAHGHAEEARAMAAVVLAGNVFTAAVRALWLPLLAGVPVLAKASSASDALPRCLQRALAAQDDAMGRALHVVHFGRDDELATSALLARAEVLSIYGDDATVAELAGRAAQGCRVLPHGHGLSALLVGRAALQTEALAAEAARRAALDIAAYDQRGCLSPHFILVEDGSAISARAFALHLAEHALPTVQQALPLGALDVAEKAACLQWRAVAAARAEVFVAGSHAVSFEGRAALRPSPGARHIGVYECSDIAEAAHSLARIGEHLKSVGVAGGHLVRARLAAALQGPRPPRVCRAGEMQTPPIAAEADGLPALEGFFRRR